MPKLRPRLAGSGCDFSFLFQSHFSLLRFSAARDPACRCAKSRMQAIDIMSSGEESDDSRSGSGDPSSDQGQGQEEEEEEEDDGEWEDPGILLNPLPAKGQGGRQRQQRQGSGGSRGKAKGVSPSAQHNGGKNTPEADAEAAEEPPLS